MKSMRISFLTLLILLFGLVLAEGGFGTAEAQDPAFSVELRLTAPAGHPGVVIYNATFTSEEDQVGEFNGMLAVSGGSASGTVPIEDSPDAVELEFSVPFGGEPEICTIENLEFGMDYFLPICDRNGHPDLDKMAFFSVSIREVIDDSTSPTCEISSLTDLVIQAEIQDTGSGLADIEVASARNVMVDIPPFSPGTTDLLLVTATVADPNSTAVLALKALDQAGNSAYCKHVQRMTRRWSRRTFFWSH